MDILNSVEVRWFVAPASEAARAAMEWFKDVEPEGKGASDRGREDLYLVTGKADLGVKARNEPGKPTKIETKYLLGALPGIQLGERCVGDVERWQKLSLKLDDPELQQQGSWLRVGKTRRLRKYAYRDGAVTSAKAGERPDAGCGVEVTELTYDGAGVSGQVVTIGLEAFGPEHELLDILLRTSTAAFDSAPSLRLAADASKSYPAWLAHLVRR